MKNDENIQNCASMESSWSKLKDYVKRFDKISCHCIGIINTVDWDE